MLATATSMDALKKEPAPSRGGVAADDLDALLANLKSTAPSANKAAVAAGPNMVSLGSEVDLSSASSNPRAPQPPAQPPSFANAMAARRASMVKEASEENIPAKLLASGPSAGTAASASTTADLNAAAAALTAGLATAAGTSSVPRRMSVIRPAPAGADGIVMFDIMAGANGGGGSDDDDDAEPISPQGASRRPPAFVRASSLAVRGTPSDASVNRTNSIRQAIISLDDDSSDEDADSDDGVPVSTGGKASAASSGRGGGAGNSSVRSGGGGSSVGGDRSHRGDRSVNGGRRPSIVHITDAELAAVDKSNRGGGDHSVRRSSSRRPTDMDGSLDFEIPTLSKVAYSMAAGISSAAGFPRNPSMMRPSVGTADYFADRSFLAAGAGASAGAGGGPAADKSPVRASDRSVTCGADKSFTGKSAMARGMNSRIQPDAEKSQRGGDKSGRPKIQRDSSVRFASTSSLSEPQVGVGRVVSRSMPGGGPTDKSYRSQLPTAQGSSGSRVPTTLPSIVPEKKKKKKGFFASLFG